ncbi:MrcB family domain-containing protein [Streptomyces canus]|uniref:MrcB family domain-containing protein n=1 Tax=Streptomyces canus TaxID=58343 RepID=UPI0033B3DEFA
MEGKDGAGQRAEVVWTRVYSKSRTPSATDGWYIVYLFSGDGERVYPSLMQGTTEWIACELKPREPAALKKRIEWGSPAHRAIRRRALRLADRDPSQRAHEAWQGL